MRKLQWIRVNLSSLRGFEKAEAIYLCKSKIKDKSLTLGESKYKLFIDSLFYH